LLVLIFSCKKDKTTTTTNTTPAPIPVGEVPTSFTRKVLIENFKGEWNPNCPVGDDSLKEMLSLDTAKIIAASIHQGDWLALTPFFNSISDHLGGVNGFPRAAFNRVPASYGTQIDSTVISIYNWRQNLTALISLSATCGLAMVTKVDNDQLNVKVYIGYNDSILKNTHLTVYLIEDSVVSQNQSNAPLGYIHNHVVRDVLTSYNGDSVSLKGGNLLVKEFAVSLNGKYTNKNHLKVVALIHVVGVDYKENEVLNCQISTLGETKKWD
jgi:hypothetical protein